MRHLTSGSANENSHVALVDLGRAKNNSISSNRLSNLALACVLLFAAALLVPVEARARAIGDPPPGAIFDLALAHPTILSGYTLFTTSFVATAATTTISFAFRESPAYFGFDDASITGPGSPTFVDPGFELATIGQNTPTGWGRWITPEDVSAIGVVAGVGNCSTPHGGIRQWCDGSVQGYDAIYQTIATTMGATYNISFWLSDNSGGRPSAPTVDMLVYATEGLPRDITPEPTSLVLMGMGLVAIGFVRHRRNTHHQIKRRQTH